MWSCFRSSTPPTNWLNHRAAVVCALLLTSMSGALGCGSRESPTGPPSEALFIVRVCRGSEQAPDGELFRVLIRDQKVIRQADDLIGAGSVMIVGGPLRRGDGGFNAPWSWHVDPDQVTLSEGSVEVCDGCPSFIEADLSYWIDNIGVYCPWSSEIIRREY